MFKGEFSHTIDSKGRMIVPAKMREQLGDTCVVTRYFDNTLAIYTQEKFDEIAKKLNIDDDYIEQYGKYKANEENAIH